MDEKEFEFERELLKKIDENFLSKDFFDRVLDPEIKIEINTETPNTAKHSELFNKFVDFARECYIHGVTVGMNMAIELYEKYNAK